MDNTRILIVTESADITADKVCMWLNHLGASYVRFNTDISPATVHRAVICRDGKVEILVGYEGRIYGIDQFETFWFRRGEFSVLQPLVKNNLFKDDARVDHSIQKHIYQEGQSLLGFVYQYIKDFKKQVNSPMHYEVNKLDCLLQAQRLGLDIAETMVFSAKSDLQVACKTGALVTKNIQDILICESGGVALAQCTEIVCEQQLLTTPETFYPSLFQQLCPKLADIRVFFIYDSFFAVSIQSYYPDAHVDFRITDCFEQQKAVLPYKLTGELKDTLKKLAEVMELESGSADFILTTEQRLIFLEINPVGQIDFISEGANLYIEKCIAQALIDLSYG